MAAALHIAFLFVLIFGASAFSATYDLIIRNGRIIDGSGNPSFRSDVAVKNGKIFLIGKTEGKATQEIDANGGEGGGTWIHRCAYARGRHPTKARSAELCQDGRYDGGDGKLWQLGAAGW